MKGRSRKEPEDGGHDQKIDSFWSAVRTHLAFRDDTAVQQEWERRWFLGVASRTTPMRLLLEQAQSLVQTKANVLIQGPSGSPRTEIARIIHDAGHDQSKPPRVCNCAGARLSKLAANMAAARKLTTTLILIHLDKADVSLQHALLGFLDANNDRTGLRCICTTTRDLWEMAVAGEFDGDLLTYLNYDRRIVVPSLKDHNWDVMPTVVSRLLHEPTESGIRHITYAAIVFLREFDWPCDLIQLIRLVDGLRLDAGDCGETAIRLEQIIKWFRHFVPPYGPVVMEQTDSADLDRWRVQLGSEEMAKLFTSQFTTTDKNDRPEAGGWDKFLEREGYCPLLFAADVGVGTLICNLHLQPLYASRRWLTSEKNATRLGWKKLLDEAEKDGTCEITVESADTEILFDLQKMAHELKPFLMLGPPGGTGKGPSQRTQVQASPARPFRRHPQRDWRIHDEVQYGYQIMGFGNLDTVCEHVASKWESISPRRVKNLYYELKGKKRPSNCTRPLDQDLHDKYPQFTRPERG